MVGYTYNGPNPFAPPYDKFQVHKVDPKTPTLGSHYGAGPAKKLPTHLVTTNKKDYTTVKTSSGDRFGHIESNGQDEVVLLHRDTVEPVAVCLLKVPGTFKIYSTRPLIPNQDPLDCKYDGFHLYSYATVQRESPTRMTVTSNDYSSYTMEKSRAHFTKKLVVKKEGQPAALIEKGGPEGFYKSQLLTINPGIDPCLIVCLAAIYEATE